MRTTLKHYQVLGVGWMRKRENAARPPHGGILADEMGLGKTIMSLACIVDKDQSNTDHMYPGFGPAVARRDQNSLFIEDRR